jgi:uncharacterized membrane protein YqjE
MPEEASSPGIFNSIRRLAATFVAILQNRFEVVSLEARQETRRIAAILLALAIAGICGLMGMIVITFLFVVAFWPQAIWVLMGFAWFYVIGGAVALFYVRKRLKEPLFPETIGQLKKDRQWLFPQN